MVVSIWYRISGCLYGWYSGGVFFVIGFGLFMSFLDILSRWNFYRGSGVLGEFVRGIC